VSGELIPYAAFGRLRLADFLPAGAEVADLADWEYMEDLWVGEAVGFTEFLRLEEEPEVVRSVALHLAELPPATSAAVLGALRLPLAPGMRLEEVTARLGPPAAVHSFATAPDRTTYEFRCGDAEPYDVSCTVHEAAGLIYVTVLAPTPRRLAVEEPDREA
jgi:hypothetical protein